MSVKYAVVKLVQIVMTVGLLVFVIFSSAHVHVAQAATVDAEHAQMDHEPNSVNCNHSEICQVHVACSLAAMSAQPGLAIALPLSKAMTLPLFDLVEPSALSLTETPPPRA